MSCRLGVDLSTFSFFISIFLFPKTTLPAVGLGLPPVGLVRYGFASWNVWSKKDRDKRRRDSNRGPLEHGAETIPPDHRVPPYPWLFTSSLNFSRYPRDTKNYYKVFFYFFKQLCIGFEEVLIFYTLVDAAWKRTQIKFSMKKLVIFKNWGNCE